MCPAKCGDGIISLTDETDEYECDDGNNEGYKLITDASGSSGNAGYGTVAGV